MSVHKTPSGKYKVKWRDRWGNQFSQTFRLKGDADSLDRRIKDGFDPRAEIETPQKAPTFAEFSERWIKDHAEVHQSYGTVNLSRNRLNVHLLPALGPKPIDQIRPSDVAALQRALLVEKGLGKSTINVTMGQLRKMFQDALTWDLIKEDPSRKIKRLKAQRQEFQFWSFVEKDRFLTYCRPRDKEMYEAVAVAVNTGLRRGELQGLLRDSVDFDRKEILVRRSYCSIGRKIEDQTKSRRSRRIEMNRTVMSVLSDRRLLPPDAQVIPYDLQLMGKKRFKDMCKAAGVSQIRWHDLRHTFASHCIMSGESIYKVQEVLGHSSITMTERYSHLSPGFSKGVTTALDAPKCSPNVPQMFPEASFEKVGEI